ncbi:ribonuclease III domain-containing protein RNC1, chloroplastic-like isoform X2 [Lycium barbarum]|nr:ribonuclease III domain-containing protein RNC1, chloroplastic-like isoform X2 [Lycium barbarum]
MAMELCSTFKPNSFDLSFSSSLSHFSLKPHVKSSNLGPKFHVLAVALDPKELPQNSPQRLLKELAERKKVVSPKRKVPPKRFILKPPLDDAKLAERFLNSPQLSLKSFPLLSSCLPCSRLNNADKTWIDEYLVEAKQCLGYPLESSESYGDDNPAKHFDTLLYLAFQHPKCERTNARHVRSGHSRLGFLGEYVLELAMCEFFLQRYPRESPGPMRERVYALIGKRYMPKWIKNASLQNLIFPYDDMDKLKRLDREPPVK